MVAVEDGLVYIPIYVYRKEVPCDVECIVVSGWD
jgi:hypothetical protein